MRLARFGFKRRRSTDDYARRIGDSFQRISLNAVYNPGFYPGAELFIYPHVWVEFPALGKKALEMVDGDAWLLGDAPALVLNDPIEWDMPKGGGRGFWHARGQAQMRECVAEAVPCIETYGIPRLDQLQTVRDFLRYCEALGIEWFAKHGRSIQLAAGYILCGNTDAARDVLDRNLGDPASRKKFGAAFAYVAGLAGEGKGLR